MSPDLTLLFSLILFVFLVLLKKFSCPIWLLGILLTGCHLTFLAMTVKLIKHASLHACSLTDCPFQHSLHRVPININRKYLNTGHDNSALCLLYKPAHCTSSPCPLCVASCLLCPFDLILVCPLLCPPLLCPTWAVGCVT